MPGGALRHVLRRAPPLRFGRTVVPPLLAKGSQKSSCRRADGKEQLSQKRRQLQAQTESQPLARKLFQFRPPGQTCQYGGAKGRNAAKGIAKTQKTAQSIMGLQLRTCKAPHAKQSASFLRPDWRISALARKRSRKEEPSQPLARKKPRTSPCVDRSWLRDGAKQISKVFDGSVSEAKHLQCHAGFKGFCIRCDVQKKPKVYEALSLQAGVPWITRGVSRGLWGLGCTACAQYLASGRKCKDARFSKFANFQVRPKTRREAKWLIEQHHLQKSHRVAIGTKSDRQRPKTAAIPPQPLACDIACPSESPVILSAEDAALLKGNVPSLVEWQDAWAVLSETVSLRKAGRLDEKRHSGKKSVGNKQRKRYRKKLLVMAEALRMKVREVLRQATSICVTLDECKYRKIIRFRADSPSASSAQPGSLWRQVGASGYSQSGVLGIIDCSKKHAEDFEEDHAVTAVKQLDVFLTKFCTPLGRVGRVVKPLACDENLKRHILVTVLCLAADGASKERRPLFLAARDLFPNLLIIIRDPAHAIRKATTALHKDDVFGEVWHELFDARHALVPDLMNSQKWANLLVAIQEDNMRVVTMPGLPGAQPLAGVLRNVAFAKQRFDSTAGPVGKIALMLLPVATLLAHMASDMRCERDIRERATALLKKFDTKFCTAIGVSADWGIILNWFLRRFDVAFHDISMSRCEIDCMIETLDAVFLEGRVFTQLLQPATAAMSSRVAAQEPLPPLHSAASGAVPHAGFITQTVMKNLRKKFVFYAGGMPVLLWKEPPLSHQQELLNRLQNVASLLKGRLLADFPRDDVRSALAMFDRRLVLKGFGPLPDSDTRRFLLRGVRQLATLLGCEEQAALKQYESVLPHMINQMAPNQPLAGKTNQQAWALLLDDTFWEAACPSRLCVASRTLRRLIRFYISIEDGECTVERDLAELRDKILQHRTDDMPFHDDILFVKLNGPSTKAEFAEGIADPQVVLTPFVRKCASLWRQWFGSRCSGGNPTKATVAARLARQQKLGKFASTVRGVLSAAHLAVVDARRQRRRRPFDANVVHPGAGTDQSAVWNESMTAFEGTTQKNVPGITQTRLRPGAPFICPASVHLQAVRAAKAKPEARRRQYCKVAFHDAASGARPSISQCETLIDRHRCAEADLVVCPDLAFLHDVDEQAAEVDRAVSLLYIVSLGVDITTQAQLAAVNNVPQRLSPQNCVRHVPAKKNEIAFCVDPRLDREHKDVRQALKRIARAQGSKFSVTKKADSAPGEIFFGNLRDVVSWACDVRRVQNEIGPKVFAPDGHGMPT